MMLSLTDTQLARRLVQYKAVIVKNGANAFPAYPYGDRRKRPISWVSQESFQKLSSFGGLESCEIGFSIKESFAARVRAGGDFGAQHRVLEEREIYVPGGVKRPARMNMALSALDRLYWRMDSGGQSLLSTAEYEAGQHYARDYALAGYDSIATQNYLSAGEDKTAYDGRAETILQSRLDARRRLEKANHALGKGLDKAVIAVCCQDIALDDVERAEQWAASSGHTILKIGLSRLAEHYGTQAGQ